MLVGVWVGVFVTVWVGVFVGGGACARDSPPMEKKLLLVSDQVRVTEAAPGAVLPPPITSCVGGVLEVPRFQSCV